ncbi:hypothetical protein FGE12_04670 [Aggregicoccus sp. 17bor-14]|uniref:lanthionine synthetase C family protein n=1 Tax=Myxococcaceae TaxID=31 RepID=UPI00129D0552|nr:MULTISPECIES: LanC-like protein [Myxococcaceae]MBF5041673.1 LanC-like protein [Simulacricoccus sp. 17bor-14]MRI87455.1 hypothetical protein [Aggregicoccus sp. 17bor-14]
MNWLPERHEPLAGAAWSPEQVRDALAALVDDVEAAWRGVDEGWPAHPRDDGERSASQYLGTAGILTGLRRMYDALGRTPRLPLPAIAEHLQHNAPPGEQHPGLLIGRTGRELAAFRELRTDASAERVLEAVRANDGAREHELLWGLPGTLLAARWMAAQTGDPRFADAAQRQARLLWDAWTHEVDGVPFWEQDLYGSRVHYLGAAHGQAGNLHALWLAARTWPGLLDRAELLARTVAFARGMAVDGPEGVNWPPLPGREAGLLHWCHGAPGIVVALSAVPPGLSPELDALLVRGAGLVWHAGPLQKGHGLCHGTAGNGFAFLALWERTGEAVWLERARAFALHALAQQARIAAEFGQGWYSLWTGDVGLGVYLCACLEGSACWDGWERF